ncbi:MAG: Plug and carboxypeptidase regulatory-like domain-containing protein, partial [Candidatus Eremiobacteraeota bacterium]|nr:Plug and carboxypeptidase regulatory-like domain-containing protein [Candidatus Eremiobacteraeota bacterium]
MRKKISSCLSTAFVTPAVVLAVLLSSLIAPVSAGTTGSLWGIATDAQTQSPLADAAVTAASPSQTTRTTTNIAGKFVFLSLLPDTYTVTVTKDGYESQQLSGVSVFADQTQNLTFVLPRAIKTIGKVSVRSSLGLVRPGIVTDVYSVNPGQTAASAPLGGGGSLNQAYSAIASMPGAFVPPSQMGVNQSVYIRGGYYDQIGYEYDGVPVNRSFDNYPGHSAATFGQQELQIYTGGGSANSNATGLAGFINQVVKTGSYPGYGNIDARIGSPTFYHDASLEVGGATANNLFSYYVGFSGYNPAFRYLDQNNGASLIDQFPVATGPSNLTTSSSLNFFPAVYPTCTQNATYTNPAASNFTNDPQCYSAFAPNYGYVSYLTGRESLGNFHFGLPHKYDSGRDDVQLLYTSSAEYRQFYSGVNDAGAAFVQALVTQGYISQPHWPDYFTYPSGTNFLDPATVQPIGYAFPGSPANRCLNTDPRVPVPGACPSGVVAALPNDYRDARWDSANIVKLQYQRNFNERMYLRVFGYTFYSNTNRSGASRRGIGSGFGATNFDYEVDAHTRGFQAQFADQLSDTNQLLVSLGYVTAATLRASNLNNFNTRNAQVSNLTDGSQCYSYTDGTADNGQDTLVAGGPAPCNDSNSQGTFRRPTRLMAQNPCASGDIPAGSPACLAGATWRLTYTGNQGGFNSVVPKFTNFAVIDEWRPTSRLDLNFSARVSRDEFDLQDTNTPGKNFWFAAAQKEFCYNPDTLQPLLIPQPPSSLSTVTPYITYACPVDKSDGVQTVHPDGMDGHLLLSNQYGRVYTQTYVEPRFGMTYTLNPDTVLRLSAGRYSQQPQNYEIQYNSFEENLAAQLFGFLPFG